MKLSELIAAVGDANIKVQRVDSSMKRVDTNAKGVTTLQLVTDQVCANDFFQGAPPPKMHGLLIWIPREKIPSKAK